ncbi:MAG TPA: hypothetical protein VG964_03625 [Candidatus Saccharimonadales bacterium]|nr:hypothetical protein [Candidatus Saccharimonadales bacterium]
MDVWGWSSPIGLGLFVMMMAATLVLLATAIRTLASTASVVPAGRSTAASASTNGRGRRASSRR